MQLLAQLNEHEVRYLVLWDFTDADSSGRTVGNFGLWVDPNHDNKTRLLSLLANMGYPNEAIRQLRHVDFFVPFAFTLKLPSGLEIDIMTAPEDCDTERFEDYYQNATPVKWEDITFHLIEWAAVSDNHAAFTGQIAASTMLIKPYRE